MGEIILGLILFQFSFYEQILNVICIRKTFGFYMKYRKILLLRCIHNFKSDWINNVDHMHISGIQPSSVNLSNNVVLKVQTWCHKSTKTGWSQMGWCKNPIILQFRSSFTTENVDAFKTLRINRSRPQNLAAYALGTLWSSSSDTHLVVGI